MTGSIERRDEFDGSCSDAELIAALSATRDEAMEALLRRYGRIVQRVAMNILRDRAEAEDVTQEVFFEVYRKAHLYDPARGTVRVWLMQYAYHRSLRRKASLRLRAAYSGEPLEHADVVEPRSRRALTSDESRWLITRGLASLPERQRQTLELAYLEGLSLREIALRLEVSLGCARHYYYRGLARMRTWLTGANPAPSDERRPRRRARVTRALPAAPKMSRVA